MRKTEQRLWDRMRRKARDRAELAPRLERIENMVGVGIPDVLAIKNGIVTWCELKSLERFPVRATTQVLGARGLSVAQRNWHYAWYLHGGRSLIVVGVGAQHVYAVPGFLADSVNFMSRKELEDFSVAQDWDALFAYLIGIK